MKYRDKGNAVAEVQSQLIELGYELHGGADGELGPITWHVLGRFTNEHGLRWVDTPHEEMAVPTEVLQTLIAQSVKGPAPFAKDYHVTTFDLRHEMNGIVPHSRVVRGKTAMRVADSITGICIHQMGRTFEPTVEQVASSGGSRRLAKARLFKSVPAHVAVSVDQFFSVHTELQHHLLHGNGFDCDTISLEIEGNYGEYLSEEDGDSLSESTIASAREAIQYVMRSGSELGMPIQYLYAHRQAQKNLVRDPGEAIWRSIATWASETYTLEMRPRHTRGNGEPVPSAWYSRKPTG